MSEDIPVPSASMPYPKMHPLPRLPLIQRLLNANPIPQPNRLTPGPLQIIPCKSLRQNALAPPYPFRIHPPHLHQLLLRRRLLDGFPRLHDLHQQLRVLDLCALVVRQVLVAPERQQILRPEEGVRERAEGVVDARRGRLRRGLGPGGGEVRVGPGLELEELPAEGAGVYWEGTVGRGPQGKGFTEEVVVGLAAWRNGRCGCGGIVW
jgi:hypothetical protein